MIRAEGLARSYRGRGNVVRDVTLRVDEGEVVGFLGPNGAGKTTTMRMLTTLLRPSAGRAQVAGCDLIADPAGVRSRIGYVPQGTGLYDENTATENLVLQGRMHGMSKRDARSRAAEVAARLDVAGFEGQLAKTLSGGQRRRVDIALALISRPRLLFLDEPTTGLDPQSRANLWEHIRSLRARTTVFLTTHYLDEADNLADRIFVIDGGTVVAEGTPAELRSTVADGDLVQVGVAPGDLAEAARIATRLPGAAHVRAEDGVVSFRSHRGEVALGSMMRTLHTAGIAVVSLQVSRPTLDDVFLALTGRSLRDDPS